MAEEKSDEYINGVEFYQKHKSRRPYSYLLVQFDPVCLPFLEIIYVSEWEYYYLKLWEEDTTQNDISAIQLLEKLNVRGIPIFQNYFAPFNGRVSLSAFLEFICTFAFFTNEQLLPLLYSISNIKSNRVITSEQILIFFHSLKVPSDQLQQVAMWMNEVERDENGFIQLNSLTAYILNERLLFYSIYSIQSQLIEYVIKRDIFVKIHKRMKYYSNPGRANIDAPPESCINYLERKIFSNYPPPFYFSYAPYNRKLNPEDILYVIRQRYGYSKRPNRQSSSMLSSKSTRHNNSMSCNNNNNNNSKDNKKGKRNSITISNKSKVNCTGVRSSLTKNSLLTISSMSTNTLKVTKSQVFMAKGACRKSSSKSVLIGNEKSFRTKTTSAKVAPVISPTTCLQMKDG